MLLSECLCTPKLAKRIVATTILPADVDLLASDLFYYHRALTSLDDAVILAPSQAFVYRERARIRMRARYYNEAIADGQRAVQNLKAI